jgi:cell cycle checkpoint protein
VSTSDFHLIPTYVDRAEDAAGPTTTCEITTFDPEPQLELDYDKDKTYSVSYFLGAGPLKMTSLNQCFKDNLQSTRLEVSSFLLLNKISQSSWLRDALSELDPSCERLTFIGNPSTSVTAGTSASENTNVKQRSVRHAIMKPMLRIQATGAFGSTEVMQI